MVLLLAVAIAGCNPCDSVVGVANAGWKLLLALILVVLVVVVLLHI